MKTPILPVIAYLAAVAAVTLLPVSAAAASIALSVTGMLSILAADYGRNLEPPRGPAPVVPIGLSRPALSECRVAA